jgi:hypothetical protein
MSLTHAQVRNRFATRRNFMVADITRGIHQARANYLVALGMLAYLEVIGGLITGDGGLIGKSRDNFNAALAHMPPAYGVFQVKVVRPGTNPVSGVYEILRCSMVHQYTPPRHSWCMRIQDIGPLPGASDSSGRAYPADPIA